MRLDENLKYFESPEFKDILEKYEAARASDSTIYMSANDLTDIAEYYSMVLQDEEKATEAIDLALQLHPNAVDPQIFRARQYMLRGDSTTAHALCDAIEDQNDREVVFLQAELLVREEKSKEAVAQLLLASDDLTEDEDFFLYDAGYIFVDYRKYDDAMVFAEHLEMIAPDWYKTLQLKADILLGEEKYKDALNYIERMLDVDPFSTEAWNWSAEVHCGLGDYAEAVTSADYALAVEPNNERALQLKSWALLQQGNLAAAHPLYQKLEEMMPENEQNWLYDSYCLLDDNKLEEAILAIERAEDLAEGLSADQLNIYEQHAQILSRKGDVDGALENLDKAMPYFIPDDDTPDLDLLRGRVMAENGRPEEALSYIQKAYDKEGTDKLKVYFCGAYHLFDCNYYDLARQMFLELEEHAADEQMKSDSQAYVAYCSMELKDDDKALEYIRKASVFGQEKLRELFSEEFPGVNPEDLYNYYYYRVNGRFPE